MCTGWPPGVASDGLLAEVAAAARPSQANLRIVGRGGSALRGGPAGTDWSAAAAACASPRAPASTWAAVAGREAGSCCRGGPIPACAGASGGPESAAPLAAGRGPGAVASCACRAGEGTPGAATVGTAQSRSWGSPRAASVSALGAGGDPAEELKSPLSAPARGSPGTPTRASARPLSPGGRLASPAGLPLSAGPSVATGASLGEPRVALLVVAGVRSDGCGRAGG